MITFEERPVNSSTCSFIVEPSMMSPNFTVPDTSERMGLANGSHWISMVPDLTRSPSFTRTCAPYTTG